MDHIPNTERRDAAPPPRPIVIDLGHDAPPVTLSPRLADPRLNLTERVLLDELFDAIDLRSSDPFASKAIDLTDFAAQLGADTSVSRDALRGLERKGLVQIGMTQAVEAERIEVIGIQLIVNVLPATEEPE